HSALMHGLDRQGQLADERSGLARRPGAFGTNQARERGALDIRHGEVVDAVDLAHIVDATQVGVLDPGRDAGLALEAFAAFRAILGGKVWHLQRDAAAELSILGEVDGAHAALPQLLEDAITAKLFRQGRVWLHGSDTHSAPYPSIQDGRTTRSRSWQVSVRVS